MVKHKIPADVRSLADRYFCEQCDRLGLPRPHPIAPVKPLKAPKHPSKPRKALSDLDELVEMGVWINTREPAPKMGLEAIWEAFDGSDGENQ